MNVKARAVASLLLVAAAAEGLTGCAASAANASAAAPARSPGEPATELVPPRPATTEETERADHRTGRVAGYVALAVGAQATVVALVTSGMMLHQDSVRSDACDANKRCTQAGIDANDNLSQLGGWNAGAWALGAVGLGVGALLLILHPSQQRPSVRLGAPGEGSGLGLRGTF